MTDSELLFRYSTHGSEEAFRELVRRHLPTVYGAALRRVENDVQRAQEVAQDVFVALARKAAALSCHPSVGGWLYVTTCLLASKAMRTHRRRQALEQKAAAMEKILGETQPPIAWAELRPVIDDVLLRLRHAEREVILLRYFHGLDFETLAQRVQTSESGARMRVERALERMRSMLEKRGLASTTALLGTVLSTQASAATAQAGLASTIASGALANISFSAKTTFFFPTVMSATKPILTAIATAALLLFSVGLYRAARASKAEQLLADLDTTTENFAVRARRAKKELGSVLDPAVSSPSPTALMPATLSDNHLAAMEKYRRASEEMHLELLGKYPEYRSAFVELQHAEIALKFQPFYEALILNSDQRQHFQVVMAESEWNRFDIVSAAISAGLDENHSSIQQMLKDADDKKLAGISEVLGEDGRRRYEEYDKAAAARMPIIDNLARYVYDSATPLLAAQADKLGKLIYQNTKLSAQPGSDRDWDAILRDARAVLSAEQMRVFEKLKVADEYYAALQLALGAARNSLPGAGK